MTARNAGRPGAGGRIEPERAFKFVFRITNWLVLVGCLRLLIAVGLWGAAPVAKPEAGAIRAPDHQALAQGRFVFQKNCVPCHGRFGEGDGELVKGWEVLPRNFRLATFKYRSTPYGKLPTDEDLTRTIRRGISGSAMPAFGQLRDEEVKTVIVFLKFLSPAWKDEDLRVPAIDLPARPEWFADEKLRAEQAAYGRALFRDTCAACHGATGAGDGLAAAGLQDSQGKPIKPADLHKPLRSGPEPEDIFRTIMTGISGTPMMGFNGALNPEAGWQLAAYLLSLQPAKP